MRSLLLVETHVQDAGLTQEHTRPQSLLESSGYLVLAAGNEADIHAHISKADAAILHLPVYEIQSWSEADSDQASASLVVVQSGCS